VILVLIACGVFALSGLASRRYGSAQNGFVFLVATALIIVQFAAARYL
jgi:hypothetical protein